MNAITIGFDLAKNVFQVHGVDVGACCCPQAPRPLGSAGILRQAGTVPYWHESMRHGPLLGLRADRVGP